MGARKKKEEQRAMSGRHLKDEIPNPSQTGQTAGRNSMGIMEPIKKIDKRLTSNSSKTKYSGIAWHSAKQEQRKLIFRFHVDVAIATCSETSWANGSEAVVHPAIDAVPRSYTFHFRSRKT